MAAEILSRIALLKTVLVTDSRVIPHQLLHMQGSPFFGNFTISPVFQSFGISSTSHIPSKISIKVVTMIYPPGFNISALTPSAPGAFPDFMELTGFLTSSTDGRSGLIFVSYWNICYIAWCFVVEDGLKV